MYVNLKLFSIVKEHSVYLHPSILYSVSRIYWHSVLSRDPVRDKWQSGGWDGAEWAGQAVLWAVLCFAVVRTVRWLADWLAGCSHSVPEMGDGAAI